MRAAKEPDARLDELDQDEFWDVIHYLKPEVTRPEYDKFWEDFQEKKRRRQLH